MSDKQPKSQVATYAQAPATSGLNHGVVQREPLEKWLGILPAFASCDEINAWVRDMREDDEDSPSAG